MTDSPATDDDGDERLGDLESALAYPFRDRDWLRLALRHRSAPPTDAAHPSSNNERLEFLGDAVLDLAIRAFLFDRYPEAQEGLLTQWRSQIAARASLATLAGTLRLDEYMRHHVPDAEGRPAQRERLLADGVEALLGAVYCDGGYGRAGAVANALLARSFEELPADPREGNPKSALQERWQRACGEPPRYEVSHVEGPSHAPHFTMVVILGEDRGEPGSGWTKREASRNAARATLDKLERGDQTHLPDPLPSATLPIGGDVDDA
ncbi:ribonuclease III [Candidatus Poribacteria bacterium]|jgi:ribonuclease III|nr:ribonuclease III [Candidatus Poribacteria bacterium]MBT7099964.1 ribonuclease III [Candidatus Poribacteria bacterium]MBT7805848.1 ribonuclease III [Candidatus Poribacteria bacterium]